MNFFVQLSPGARYLDTDARKMEVRVVTAPKREVHETNGHVPVEMFLDIATRLKFDSVRYDRVQAK